MEAKDYGLTVTLTDNAVFEEWSFWKKLRIYLFTPCRCGLLRCHHGWPKSPADIMREATKQMADALERADDEHFMRGYLDR